MIKQRRICRTIVLVVFFAGILTGAFRQEAGEENLEETAAEEQTVMPKTPLYAGILAEFQNNEMAVLEKNKEILVAAAERTTNPENDVYTFLQGPKSWSEGRLWSGEWSNQYVRGNYFGNFGCGLCCMANIYCTMTDYTCSPWDMFEHAREVSGYSPTRKTGAIGWGDMKVTMRKSGFDCTLCNKPESYEAFRQQIGEAESAIVLVCSSDDDTFWENTGGHYVNISLYNAQTDEVFLADPGSPDRNRSHIPLRYVYDALKTSSQYQYLLVNSYAEENNLWKQDGIDEAWVAP